MSLKFWLGGARSDKSNKLYEYVLEEAQKNPDREYLVVVPEQFTLATQRELVLRSVNHGILNVDVLSFMRLAHRISDEVGGYDNTVITLDEMGKNLILQLIASDNKENLKVLGKNVDKLGMIGEIKSVISEFMQYGISPEQVLDMAKVAKDKQKGMLEAKLLDINYLYNSFVDYINKKYTTTEETLERIAAIIPSSETIKKSVIVFDGFTGFTPVQRRLIGTLLENSLEIHVGLLLEGEECTGENDKAIKDHELFYLSKTTVSQLEKLAKDREIVIQPPYVANSQITKPQIHIFQGQNPEEELRLVTVNIRRLIDECGYRYKDIAIVAGDLEGYRHIAERVMQKAKLPIFIDRTEPLLLNPFVEFIRSLINIFVEDYSYESMFRFLKSGLIDIDNKDVCLLDNYCTALGVKGYKKWHTRFVHTTSQISSEDVLEVEELRAKYITYVDMFIDNLCDSGLEDINWNAIKKDNAIPVIKLNMALYKTIVAHGIEQKLSSMSNHFEETGDTSHAEEYKQIYARIMDILDEVATLIPQEKVSIKEYGQLIDAALESIRIGVAPKSQDYIQIGDLTRSRINNVKALFIVGANEGIIPKQASGGGLINDAEKEFLLDSGDGISLSPTVREEAFEQRLYLYMAMNKPESNLYISFAKVSNDGKSQMPSYIVRQILKENHDIKVETFSENLFERLGCIEDAFKEFALLINKASTSGVSTEENENIKKLLKYFVKDAKYSDRARRIVRNALIKSDFMEEDSIGKALAHAIYGKQIVGSVTRLEVYANCAYQYFLKYGLKLRQKEIFSFEAKDMGTIFHDSLSEYSELMNKKGMSWFDIGDDEVEDLMNQAVDTTIAKNQMAALYSTARTTYMVNRIKRIMLRTAGVITSQIQRGDFVPKYFEIDFKSMYSIESLNIKLSPEEEMKLLGRIDRIDTCEKENGVYIKIIDYKSSNKKMDLAAVYEGRQLQLLVYLNAAMESEGRKHNKEIIPAGILYYHIDDPIVGEDDAMSDDEIKLEIMKNLKLSGLLNGDDNGSVIEMIDKHIGEGSTVVSARKLKSGEVKSQEIVSGDDFKVMTQYVNKKIADIGRQILDGNIEIPSPDGKDRYTQPDCTYCEYSSMCVRKDLMSDKSETGGADNSDEWIRLMNEKINDTAK